MRNNTQLLIYDKNEIDISLDHLTSLNAFVKNPTSISITDTEIKLDVSTPPVSPITNGDFTSSLTGWDAYNGFYWSYKNGGMAEAADYTQNSILQQVLKLDPNVVYKMEVKYDYTFSNGTPANVYARWYCGEGIDSNNYFYQVQKNTVGGIAYLSFTSSQLDYGGGNTDKIYIYKTPGALLNIHYVKIYIDDTYMTTYLSGTTISNNITPLQKYIVEYNVSGAKYNSEHYITLLGGSKSKSNFGNGHFKVDIFAKQVSTYMDPVLKTKYNSSIGFIMTKTRSGSAFSNITIYKETEYELDLYDNDWIALTYQISDVKDFTSRNTSFSKTITLPGTDNNNRVLRQIYKVSNDNTFLFEYPVRTILKNNTLDIFNGYFYLQNCALKNKDNTIEYQVDLRSNLQNLFSLTSERYMRGNQDDSYDLDLSEYDHIYNYNNISGSWWKGSTIKSGYNFLPSKPITNYELGKGYTYPLIDYGFNEYNIKLEQLHPAVFVKELWDQIINRVGYTYTSNFLNSDRFKRLILPQVMPMTLSQDKADLRNADYSVNSFQGPKSNGKWELYVDHYTGQNFNEYSVVKTLPTSIIDGTNQNTYYIVPNRGIYKFVLDIKKVSFGFYLFNSSTQTVIFSGLDADNPLAQLRLAIVREYVDGGITKTQELGSKYIIPDYFIQGDKKVLYSSQDALSNPAYIVWVPQPFDDVLAIDETELLRGDKIYITAQLISKHRHATTNNWRYIDILGRPISTSVTVQFANYGTGGMAFHAKCIGGYTLYEGDYVTMNQSIPEKSIKQSDFLTSIIKMFNLYIQEDPNDINNLIIEPRDDFYNGGSIIDWSQKRDFNAEFLIEPASDLINKNVMLKWKTDDDYYNTSYNSTNKPKEYGENYIKANQITTETYEIIPDFAPTPVAPFVDANINKNAIMVPVISTRNDVGAFVEGETYEPRIMLWNGIQYWDDTNRTARWRIMANETNAFTQCFIKGATNRPGQPGNTNWFPCAGHFDSPYTKQPFDLNFGVNNWYWWLPNNEYPYNNLTYNYYYNMLEELSSEDCKKVTTWFDLTSRDIAKFNFRNYYVVDGVYYRVNKIIDYTPNQLTQVELIKIIKQVLPISPDKSSRWLRDDWYYRDAKSLEKIQDRPINRLGYLDAEYEATSYLDNVRTFERANNEYSGVGISIWSGSYGNEIKGKNIQVRNDVTYSQVLNSENVIIESNNTNVYVLNSNDIYVNESDVSYINNVRYKDGIATQKIDIIDGGEDTVQNLYSQIEYNLIDGGEDTIRESGSLSPINVMDGNTKPYLYKGTQNYY